MILFSNNIKINSNLSNLHSKALNNLHQYLKLFSNAIRFSSSIVDPFMWMIY